MKRRILTQGIPLKELATAAGAELHGSPELLITGMCSLENPVPNQITFARVKGSVSLAQLLSSNRISALLISNRNPIPPGRTDSTAVLTAPEPYSAFLKLLPFFYEALEWPEGVHPSAVVASDAVLGPGSYVGPGCIVGDRVKIGEGTILISGVTLYDDVEVGARTVLHAGVCVRHECTIGSDCIVHNNAVIGADGFGFVPTGQGGLAKVPQVGRTLIGNSVEIGANACIDRGAFGDTVVGNGTKIDNLVQVGHNVVLGSNVILCGQVGVGGSCVLGDGVVLGGQVGVADHLRIAAGSRVAGQGGVTSSLTQKGDYAGLPAIPARAWRRQVGLVSRLAEKTDSLKGAVGGSTSADQIGVAGQKDPTDDNAP